MNQPAVIYLSWIPYGIGYFETFLSSYIRCKAGADHRLVILFNGVRHESDYTPFLKLAKEKLAYPVDYMVMESGQDIDAYFYAAQKVQSENILFFNTYSRINADQWLFKYENIMKDSQIGLVSASGSALSYFSAVFQKKCAEDEKGSSLSGYIRCIKLHIKAALYWRFLFPAFPNFHVRSNAFMVRRSLFLSLHCPPLTSKFNAYRFESGYHSMTRQILKSGYRVKVVDIAGKSYDLAELQQIPLFWKGNQELLLVSDNQTDTYQLAAPEEKAKMSYIAWGEKPAK